MAVKQIQLRGISRTPSDRMTRDGGLAESLNMQLDGEELAPMRLPKDVTEDLLGEGVTLDGKVLYIHKGNGYTNYIVEKPGRGFYALSDGEVKNIENVYNALEIKNIGNMLIVRLSNGTVGYWLWEDSAYVLKPLDALDLMGEFVTELSSQGTNTDVYEPEAPNVGDPYYAIKYLLYGYDTTTWNSLLQNPESAMTDEEKAGLSYIREMQEAMWAAFDEIRETNRGYSAFTTPVLARYAVRLFDGSYGFVSAPVLLGGWRENAMSVSTILATSHKYSIYTASPWKAFFKLGKTIPASWKELVVSVDIFLSEDILYPSYAANIYEAGAQELTFDGEQNDKKAASAKAAFLSASNFFRIASLSIEDLEALGTTNRYDLLTEKMNGREDYRVTQTRLQETTRYGLVPNGMMVYNGRLLALGASYTLKANYSYMFGPAYATAADISVYKRNYKIRFFIKNDGKEYTVDVRNASGVTIGSSSTSHGWAALFFPNVHCYKAEFLRADTGTSLYTVKMEEHPSLNCAYAFLGFGVNLIDSTPVTASDFTGEAGAQVSEPNKLSMTRVDNPFVFELGNTQTFDEDIIGAATIAKALIANPYGLADIYVFTKSGIFSISLMADGSFSNIHPYTRDVALPGTIAMIDHAIVFTTDKAVFLLSESGLQDISQTMRGKHDPLPASVASLLALDTDFASLVPAAQDNKPFMAFAKGARAAFDYVGNRIVFFNDAFKYQYVFILDTATWHKTDLVQSNYGYVVLNSYPQCIVATTDTVAEHTGRFMDVAAYGQSHQNEETIANIIVHYAPPEAGLTEQDIIRDLEENGIFTVEVTDWESQTIDDIENGIETGDYGVVTFHEQEVVDVTQSLKDISTILDDNDYLNPTTPTTGNIVKGLIATRPLAFDAPDIRKVLKDIRIRTQADKGDVKYLLLASMDGKTWIRLTSKGGGSFKWFRLVLLTKLAPIERIGWLDVDVETRYTNKLR